MCNPAWRMLSSSWSHLHITAPLMTAAPPSPAPASCLLTDWEMGGKYNRAHPFSLVGIKSALLTATGARESLSSRLSQHGCWVCFVCFFLPPPASCSQPLGGDAQLTHSSPLPPFCGHVIWVATKYGRSPATAAPSASQRLPGAVCVCVRVCACVRVCGYYS